MNNMKVKQSVHYNGKVIKLPFLIVKETLNTEMETVTNPFSGQSIAMPKFAVAVYDIIMGSQQIATKADQLHGDGSSPLWNDVRKGLDWFRKYFAKEYMVLLD